MKLTQAIKILLTLSTITLSLTFAASSFAATGKSHTAISPIIVAANIMHLEYLPKLQVTTACHPYTAVDQQGNWNNGLKDSGSASGSCSSTSYQQVYSRSKDIDNNVTAIMYAYYFPKDNGIPFPSIGHRHDWEHVIVFVQDYGSNSEKIIGAAYSSHGNAIGESAPNKSGKHIYIHYAYHASFTHSFDEGSTGSNDEHQLIDYDNLSVQAIATLNNHSFGDAIVPFKESKFDENIAEAAAALNL